MRVRGGEKPMTAKSEEEIVNDLLDYADQHRSVCIKTERQAQTEWIRKADGGWLLVRHDSQGNIDSRTLGDGAMKAILKANYYRLVPASQARREGQNSSIWEELEDDQNHD